MGHGDCTGAGAVVNPALPSRAKRSQPVVTTLQPASRFLLFPAPVRSDVTAMFSARVSLLLAALESGPGSPVHPGVSPVHSRGIPRAGRSPHLS